MVTRSRDIRPYRLPRIDMRSAITASRSWMFAFLLLLAHFLGVLCHATVATGEEPSTNRDEGFDQLTELVPEYVLRPHADRSQPFQLVKQPILRWTNPVRKARDGALFLWLDGARPAAVMCAFWSGDSKYKHEFHSLYQEPFTGVIASETVWLPSEAGVDFRDAPGSPEVAESERLRLVQMRRIASAYRGSIVPANKPEEQLRLLSQPLYRYVGDKGTPEVVDGAIFAFAQTTDPEILVLVEAREYSSGATGWHVAFARMSRWPLQISYSSEVVWSCDWGPAKMEDSYRVLSHDVERLQ